MAKETEFISERHIVGGLRRTGKRGPIVPVRRGQQVRWLQDGRYIPAWLIWLRQRRLVLALLLLVAVAVAAARLIGGTK